MASLAIDRRHSSTTLRYSARTASPAKLTVLHAITPSKMAGAETFLARLIKHSTGGPVEHRCVISAGSPVIEEFRAAGVEAQPLGIGGKGNLLAVSRLARAARECGASMIASHLSTASWWCGWLERLGGLPTVGHVQGFTSKRWHSNQSHLVTCSHAVKQDLIEKGIPGSKITPMHLPVAEEDLKQTRSRGEVRRELGVDESTPVVGTFAHLSLKKGHFELVEAARRVLDEMPNAQFWCFGGGKLRNEVQSQAESLGISDRFRLLGYRRDVPNLMRAIDVMALPSHREPFGLVYVEAALCGRPVVACQAGGAPEIVQHGETGLLVPPKSSPALAAAILELLSSRGRAERMGRAGGEFCRERFRWDQYVEAINGLYEAVASGCRVEVPALRPS